MVVSTPDRQVTHSFAGRRAIDRRRMEISSTWSDGEKSRRAHAAQVRLEALWLSIFGDGQLQALKRLSNSGH